MSRVVAASVGVPLLIPKPEIGPALIGCALITCSPASDASKRCGRGKISMMHMADNVVTVYRVVNAR